jgi:hypothetical protein
MQLVSVIVHGRWQPGLGDNSPLGWLITLGYFAACGLCVWAGLRELEAFRTAKQPLIWRFWFILAAMLFLLGFNKQLDLQSLLTQIGRDVAKSLGLYGARRGIQAIFVIIMIALAGVAIYFGYQRMRLVWKRYWLPLIGMILLVAYVIIRMASFHHVDVLLKKRADGGIGLNWILELGGCIVVGFAAFKAATEKHESKYVAFEKKVSLR